MTFTVRPLESDLISLEARQLPKSTHAFATWRHCEPQGLRWYSKHGYVYRRCVAIRENADLTTSMHS